MAIFQKYKKIFLFVGIFILLFIVYELFFSGGKPASKTSLLSPIQSGLVSELSVSPADAIVGQKLLSILGQLQSISLNPSIFATPVFGSFKDWSKPIAPQPFGKALGRRNPFSDFSQSGTVSGAAKVPAAVSPLSSGAPGKGSR